MKKFLLIAFLLLFSFGNALGFSCVESRAVGFDVQGAGIILTVTCTLETGDTGEQTYTITNYADSIEGWWLYTIEIVPGTGAAAPTGTFDLDVQNENGFHLVDSNANSNTATTWIVANVTLGQYPRMRGPITLAFADFGGDDDAVTTHLHF